LWAAERARLKRGRAAMETPKPLPFDLKSYGEDRLTSHPADLLRAECQLRRIPLPNPQARRATCVKLLLEWKQKSSAAGAAKPLPFDLKSYGEDRLMNHDADLLRAECQLRRIDIKPQAQRATCVEKLLKWKQERETGGATRKRAAAPATEPQKKKPKAATEPASAEKYIFALRFRNLIKITMKEPNVPLFRLEKECCTFSKLHERFQGCRMPSRWRLVCGVDGDDSEEEEAPESEDEFKRWELTGHVSQCFGSLDTATKAAANLVRKMLKGESERIDLDPDAVDEIEEKRIDFKSFLKRSFEENVIMHYDGYRGQESRRKAKTLIYKRSWTDEDGFACEASFSVDVLPWKLLGEPSPPP